MQIVAALLAVSPWAAQVSNGARLIATLASTNAALKVSLVHPLALIILQFRHKVDG